MLALNCKVCQKTAPHLSGICGGAVCSIVLPLMQLHRKEFNIEFETKFQSVQVADS